MILRQLKILIFSLMPVILISGSKFDISQFISDTLVVKLPVDSLYLTDNLSINIIDDRTIPGRILGIQQKKKWKYIPVDQYIVIREDLAPIIADYFTMDSVDYAGTLYVKNLVHWYDGKPFFKKGRRLNAYTVLEDSNGMVISDWMWELFLKPRKKQKSDMVIGELTDRWLSAQVSAIQKQDFHRSFYPYLYRRQLMNWWDLVLLRDGYILNGHLTLDFPADQMSDWVRGSPGIFYRCGHHHQSIAIGGKDQQWYYRINDNLIRRLSLSYRFGFNNFDKDKYNHLDIWNIFLVNINANASIEYRPVYLKGLFFGLGVHTSLNILPEVIQRVEPGILLTTGFILP